MRFSRNKLKETTRVVLCLSSLLMLSGVLALLYVDESPLFLLVDQHRYDEEIKRAAVRHHLSPALLRALILRESRFNAGAVGGKGEIGLMQIMPGKSGAVAEWSRIHRRPAPEKFELFDVGINLDIGAWFLARALHRWQNYRCAEELALAEYNAGYSRAKQWKPEKPDDSVIPRITLPETRKYVSFIMRHYRKEIER